MLELLIEKSAGPDILVQLYDVIIPAVEDAIAFNETLLLGKVKEVSLPAFKEIAPAVDKLPLVPLANNFVCNENNIMKINAFIM